jgi:hypothetical protein
MAFASILGVWAMAACSLTDINKPEESQMFSIDPVFRIFIRNIGGQKIIGPAISSVLDYGDKKTQFFEKGMLIFDPNASPVGMVQFWPVGMELQVEEPPIETPGFIEDGALFINGHYISPDFARFFNQIGGLPVTGNPLTEMRYNPSYQRYEQFFENVGMYQGNSNNADVNLLSYGSWMCAKKCGPGLDGSGILDVGLPILEPYLSEINKTGRDFIGYPLDCKIDAPDQSSSEIKVFKNLVMTSDPQTSGSMKYLPLPELIGIQKEAPSPQVFEDRAVFVPTTNDGEGFNVPTPLMEYLERHGGLGVSGLPIERFQEYGKGFRQCFEHLCLTHQPETVPWLQTQPEALGYFFIRLHPECMKSKLQKFEGADQALSEGNPSEIRINSWEEYPYISPGYAQTIHVLLKDEVNRPLAGYEAELVVKVPDNSGDITIKFPPTDGSGQTQVEVPILVLPSGILVPYQVCVVNDNEEICADDDYVIWENP